MHITICNPTREHYEKIVSLHAESFPLEYDRSFFRLCIDQSLLVEQPFKCFVALVDNAIAGVVTGRLVHTSFKGPHTDLQKHALSPFLLRDAKRCEECYHYGCECCGTFGYLMTLAVTPHMKRKGIGKALLREFEAAMEGYGALGVYLHALSSNREATQFYNSVDYSLVETLHDFYIIHDKDVAANIFCHIYSSTPERVYSYYDIRKRGIQFVLRTLKMKDEFEEYYLLNAASGH